MEAVPLYLRKGLQALLQDKPNMPSCADSLRRLQYCSELCLLMLQIMPHRGCSTQIAQNCFRGPRAGAIAKC